MLIEHPEELRSIAVQMGRHTVFLPPLDDSEDLYDRLARYRGRDNQFEADWAGKLIPWPDSPKHVLDFE